MKIISLRKLNNLKYLSFFILVGFVISCRPNMKSKNQSNGIGGDFFTSFYINDSETKYYIKPFKFSSGKETLICDITYSVINNSVDNITYNFSIITDSRILNKSVHKIRINSFEFDDFKILYNDVLKNKFDLRISSNLPPDILYSFDEKTTIKIITENKIFNFEPANKKSKKILKKIPELVKF